MFNKKHTCLLPLRAISVISKYELNINLHVLLAQPQKILMLRAITFQNGWFPAKDLRDTLKLTAKVINDINKTKTAPNPNHRSNNDVLLYDGFVSLQTALTFHGGYVGLRHYSRNFKYGFNVSKQLYLYNVNQRIGYDAIVKLFKKYGIITKFTRAKEYVEIDIFTNASYDTIIKYVNSITINGRTFVAQKRN